jgi:hypothetical protein
MLGFGYLVGAIKPELKLTEFSPQYTLSIKMIFRAIVSILAMVGLQFWLSFRIKNFIIPLGIGMVLMITGLVLYKGEESIYYTYSYNMLSLLPRGETMPNLSWFPTVSFWSLGYFLLFTILGYIDISKSNVK